MSTNAPSDDQLSKEFEVDPSVELSALADQVKALTPSSIVPVHNIRTRKHPEKQAEPKTPGAKATTLDNPPAVQKRKQQQSTRGSNRGRGKGKVVPQRDNQIQALTSAMSEADADNGVPIPDADALTSNEIDMMSARSSRLEETIEDHTLQLHSSSVRIKSLEDENSHLVARINVLTTELSKIKEMLTSPSGTANSTGSLKGKTLGASSLTKAPPSSDRAEALSGLSSQQSQLAPVQPQNTSVASRPVPKRKFIE